VGGWAQAAVAAIVAFTSGLGWTAWLGTWVGGVDHRLVVVERFADAHDDRWTAEIHGVDARVASIERDCGRLQAENPLKMQHIEKRLETTEELLQKFIDFGQLIRDSNDLQRQRMTVDQAQFILDKQNAKPKR